jgi:DNA-binding NarL/FixJ family response regulator
MNEETETTPNDNSCRILLVEDHPVFRKGLKFLIEEEESLSVCGEADSTATALAQVKSQNPDVVVLDIGLKGRDGLGLIQDLTTLKTSLLVLVVSMFNETAYVRRALQEGARGYVVKSESARAIVTAIYAVIRGELPISEPHRTRIIEGNINSPGSDPLVTPHEILTNRELEVFRLIGRGNTRKEISEKLILSIKTISTYQEKIKDKLGLKNSAELAKHAFQYMENQNFGG